MKWCGVFRSLDMVLIFLSKFVVVVSWSVGKTVARSTFSFFFFGFFLGLILCVFFYFFLFHLINKNVCAFSVSLRHNPTTLRHIPVWVVWFWLVDGLPALFSLHSPAAVLSPSSSSSFSLSDSSTVICKQPDKWVYYNQKAHPSSMCSWLNVWSSSNAIYSNVLTWKRMRSSAVSSSVCGGDGGIMLW